MRAQSSIFRLSSFPSSRHVHLRSRPILTAISHHHHHFPTRLFVHRNNYSTTSLDELTPIPSPSSPSPSTTSPDELTPPSSPSPSPSPFTSTPEPLIKVSDIPAPHLGHIRILSLNRPENRNALSWELVNNLEKEIKRVRAQGVVLPSASRKAIIDTDGSINFEHGDMRGDIPEIENPTRVLIVASELEVFCAGADLKERAKMKIGETKEFVSRLNAVFQSLSCLHVPTISAVGGAAVGGGFELALATDVRVFSSSTRVSLPETRIGIIPGAGGTYRLREIIGEPRALEMILTGRRVWGPLAYSYGLCQRMVKAVPGHESRVAVLAESIKCAREICEGAPLAVRAALRAVKGGTLRVEEREYHSVLITKDRDRALAAYGHKVTPEFKGD